MSLKVEYVPIGTLKPYENNAKIHTPEQIEQIKRSIRDFGMNDPIGIWGEDNLIVEGHGRLMACQELGYQEVPVIRLDDLTDEQRRAYTLIHNQTTMNTGFDLEILNEELAKIDLDMDDYGFDEITQTDIEIEEDDFNLDDDDPTAEAKSKPGEVYQLGNHRLMCGDSTKAEDVAKLVKGELADLVMTDPPYNVDVSNSKGMKIENDNMSSPEFAKFINAAMRNMSDSLKVGGSFYVWYGDSEDIAFRQACMNNGMTVKQCLIWVKNSFTLGRQDYQWRHEPCLYGWKEGEGHYFIYDRTQDTVIEDKPIDFDAITREDAVKLLKKLYSDLTPSTVINQDKPTENKLHPTMKPLPMIGRLINNSTRKNDLVLDLFGGSGTTMMACEQLNRRAYLMEFDPHYVDVIIERWEEMTGKKAIKVEE